MHKVKLIALQEVLGPKSTYDELPNHHWPGYLSHHSNKNTAILWHKDIAKFVNRINDIKLTHSLKHWATAVHIKFPTISLIYVSYYRSPSNQTVAHVYSQMQDLLGGMQKGRPWFLSIF